METVETELKKNEKDPSDDPITIEVPGSTFRRVATQMKLVSGLEISCCRKCMKWREIEFPFVSSRGATSFMNGKCEEMIDDCPWVSLIIYGFTCIMASNL